MRKYRKKTKKKVKFRRNKTRVKRKNARGNISIHQLMSTIGANPNLIHFINLDIIQLFHLHNILNISLYYIILYNEIFAES